MVLCKTLQGNKRLGGSLSHVVISDPATGACETGVGHWKEESGDHFAAKTDRTQHHQVKDLAKMVRFSSGGCTHHKNLTAFVGDFTQRGEKLPNSG